MNIIIRTLVTADFEQVHTAFDERLFKALAPPLLPVKLVRFDGSKKGDEVHLKFPMKMEWISLITDNQLDKNRMSFIDEGIKLPFPLTFWKHEHIVLRKSNQTEIVDNINYHTSYKILDWLVYPLLYIQFLYRKPVYKKYFHKKNI